MNRFHFPNRNIFPGLLISLFILTTANAQYFGRNKVNYEHFNFKVMHTPHFNIYFYPEEEVPVRDAARMAERWYERLSRVFDYKLSEKKPIILYADHPDFQQTNAISGLLSEGTGGVTEALKTRVVLPFTGYYKENDHVLGHELVHAFQYDIAQQRGYRGLSSMAQLPLWAIEGLAEYLSLGRIDPNTAMWFRDGVLHKDLPTIKQLGRDPRYFPYRFGQGLWAFIGGKWSDTVVTQLYKIAARQGLDAAVENVLQMSVDSLSQLWIQDIKQTYAPLLKDKTPPSQIGKKILAKDVDAGDVNLGPVLSPDGKYVAFFSEKDIFTFDIFMADAHTGKIIKKLASADRDPHFDALSFMNNAGTWSPDSRKFAFVVFADGDNELVITDVFSGKIEKKFHFKQIGAIASPAWSPDGGKIVFSGMSGGLSNLYLLDLSTGQVEQLTNDKYAEMQPAWSPDGQFIAFATDRGSGTNFNLLYYSEPRLAIMNLKTREIKLLGLFPTGKQISPQFDLTGNNLIFVADPDGFSNIYRYNLKSGEIFKLTNIATGVSGLTYLSPAITVARSASNILFTVFEHRRYNGYSLNLATTPGTLWERGKPVNFLAGILPPVHATATSLVVQYLKDYRTGLPADTSFTVENYHASLGLDYIGQPILGVSVDRFGTSLGGAVSAYFSDMLGNHVLGVAIQANGGLKDLGGQLLYQNRSHRWNWGGVLAHIPYRSTQQLVSPILVEISGQVYQGTLIEQFNDRVFLDALNGILEYPFSTTRRFEVNGGFTRISYSREIETIVQVGNQVVDRKVQKLPAPSAINLFQVAPALVGDYTYYGFTSPTRGGRYRFEVEPTIGTLQFFSALADYRKYYFHRPFTLAFRFLHYGRYGRDSESNRLSPLFLGYETFIRGYAAESFKSTECTFDPQNPEACPEFDRLLGSRIAVTNLEFRVPLFGNENFGIINFPFLPTEFSIFLDGGVAWSSSEKPVWKFARHTRDRVPVFSTGFSLRINLLGYLVYEIYYAYPFQRPGKGWHFGFQIAPGW